MSSFQDMIVNGIVAVGIVYTAVIVVVTAVITIQYTKWKGGK